MPFRAGCASVTIATFPLRPRISVPILQPLDLRTTHGAGNDQAESGQNRPSVPLLLMLSLGTAQHHATAQSPSSADKTTVQDSLRSRWICNARLLLGWLTCEKSEQLA
jgi:hypothetical protein